MSMVSRILLRVMRTLRNVACRMALLPLLGTGAPAWATYVCQGAIEQAALNSSGTLTVVSSAAGLSSVYICQIGATAYGVGPEQCKAIYSLLLVAKSSVQSVQWSYLDGLTCATHPRWAPLTEWYYGPVLVDP
jgi:DNA-binding transcriptional regulator YdaS (Cro superfamily)